MNNNKEKSNEIKIFIKDKEILIKNKIKFYIYIIHLFLIILFLKKITNKKINKFFQKKFETKFIKFIISLGLSINSEFQEEYQKTIKQIYYYKLQIKKTDYEIYKNKKIIIETIVLIFSIIICIINIHKNKLLEDYIQLILNFILFLILCTDIYKTLKNLIKEKSKTKRKLINKKKNLEKTKIKYEKQFLKELIKNFKYKIH